MTPFQHFIHISIFSCSVLSIFFGNSKILCAQDTGERLPEIFATADSNDLHPASSPVDTWVRLQTGLYDLVFTFDEQAKRMEKYLPAFEKLQLEKRVAAVKNQGNDDHKRPSLEEQIQFDAVAREPTMCALLDQKLKSYILDNRDALDSVVKAIVQMTATMDERAKADFAKRIAVASAAITTRQRAQQILYLCVYKLKDETGKPRDYSVERTMREWYRSQLPILDAWLGNVD